MGEVVIVCRTWLIDEGLYMVARTGSDSASRLQTSQRVSVSEGGVLQLREDKQQSLLRILAALDWGLFRDFHGSVAKVFRAGWWKITRGTVSRGIDLFLSHGIFSFIDPPVLHIRQRN